MRKRHRACEECHGLKIKCSVTTCPGESCERCLRNNLVCVPAAARLQRDRVLELEAQVRELKLALQDKGTSTSATPNLSSLSLLDSHNHAVLSFLDARIPPNRQQYLFRQSAYKIETAWPVIRLPIDIDGLREKSPILLLSVLVYCVTHEEQGTQLEVHDELVRETMHILGEEVIGRGQRSLELVQALLVTAFWSKFTRQGQQGSCYQIVQLAADMAIDLGIAGTSLQPSPAAYFCRHLDATSLEARRTWLACFVALSTSSISTRRPNTVPWNSHHQECLLHLEKLGDIADLLFCQIVRITRVIEEISHHLRLCQLSVYVDGNDYSTHADIQLFKNKVDAWTAQIHPSLESSQTLEVWRNVAMVHLYELVLHTPTNKASFAAPFIPGRIAVKDYPRPTNVIPPLQSALESIIHHCHAVIDTATEMDAALILGLPTFGFAPIVVYSLFILVNALVAATDPSNTYGKFVAEDDFRIEQCGVKLQDLVSRIKSLDPTLSSYTTRLFDATSWLKQWYNDYKAILRRYELNIGAS